MGKMKDFIEDFLDIANNEMRDTYEHKNWDFDNLPEVEIMFEVMRRFEKQKKDKKRDAK
tara:strand:+ start:2026 stop:2202 length:177 start_codon:yes stop_codon:yes gene_type:complete